MERVKANQRHISSVRTAAALLYLSLFLSLSLCPNHSSLLPHSCATAGTPGWWGGWRPRWQRHQRSSWPERTPRRSVTWVLTRIIGITQTSKCSQAVVWGSGRTVLLVCRVLGFRYSTERKWVTAQLSWKHRRWSEWDGIRKTSARSVVCFFFSFFLHYYFHCIVS